MLRPRPAAIAAGCLLVLVVAGSFAGWLQRDLLRSSAAHFLRERLAEEFGAEFQAGEVVWRWFPPAVSLGRVTLHRRGEPWVLTADDLRVSFNAYAVLFKGERVGKIVLEHPHLFVRRRAPSSPGPEVPPSPAAARGGRDRFFGSSLPFKALEVRDGKVDYRHADGRLVRAAGIDIDMYLASGRARGTFQSRTVSAEFDGRGFEFGQTAAEFTLEKSAIRVGELTIDGEALSMSARGGIGYDGALSLAVEAQVSVAPALTLLGSAPDFGGTVQYTGQIGGSWASPRLEGAVAVRRPRIGAGELPDGEGLLRWDGKELNLEAVRFTAGEGILTASARVDAAERPLRYRLDADVKSFDLSRMPFTADSSLAALREVGGSLSWEGAGPPGRGGTGRGRVALEFTHAGRPREAVALAVEAVLAGDRLEVPDFRVTAPFAEARGTASWRRGAGFAGEVAAEGDLETLVPDLGTPLGGRARVAGAFTIGSDGPGFDGTLTLERVRAADFVGLEGSSRLIVTADALHLTAGSLLWAGGTASVEGRIGIPDGGLDLRLELKGMDLGAAAEALRPGRDSIRGVLRGRMAVRGTLRSPVVEGEVWGDRVGIGKLADAVASARFRLGGGSLGLHELRVEAGTTAFVARGELRGDEIVSAQFASTAFDLRDLAPGIALDLAGSIQGQVRGKLGDPEVSGELQATRLRGGGWDFGTGLISGELRGGVIALRGQIAGEANRLRAVIEPRHGWRFEAEVDMQRFAPTVVRDGPSPLPQAIVRTLGGGSLLATGKLGVRGALAEPGSYRGSLVLETLWFHAAGRTLQNQGPVKISWGHGSLEVEQLKLAGDQYHVEVQGAGSSSAGWNLRAGGAVNLALFREYWDVIEEIDGLGDVSLRLVGPWNEPVPEGTITIREGLVKVSPLPEPLENLEGRIELRAGTIEAPALKGTIGDGVFRGAGSYSFADGHLDAEVEGRLDLSLFRSRLQGARDLRGPVQVRLHIQGPLEDPGFTGEFDVDGAELFLRSFPAKITRVRGSVLVFSDRVEIKGLEGQIGGGILRLAGAVDLGGEAARADLDLEGDGVQLSLAGDFKVQADLRLGLHGALGDLKLSGDVQLLKGRYLREFGDAPPKAPAGSDSPSRVNGGGVDLSSIVLEIGIHATDNFWIANRTAKIEAAAELAIGGTVGAPRLSGEVQAIRGGAFYLSREFRLESATLRFTPPERVPRLALQASTAVGEVQILFLLDGPINKLTYHITSLPPMSREDLVSLITIGETRSGLASRGEGASAVGAALFSTEPLVSALSDEFRSSMGVEVLQLEPIVGEDNQISARVTVGTHLSDRLFASYSQTLGATEDQQFKVEYSVLDYFALWGQELRQGVYSLDLVFRYAFR